MPSLSLVASKSMSRCAEQDLFRETRPGQMPREESLEQQPTSLLKRHGECNGRPEKKRPAPERNEEARGGRWAPCFLSTSFCHHCAIHS